MRGNPGAVERSAASFAIRDPMMSVGSEGKLSTRLANREMSSTVGCNFNPHVSEQLAGVAVVGALIDHAFSSSGKQTRHRS